jgi:hypothetical protein
MVFTIKYGIFPVIFPLNQSIQVRLQRLSPRSASWAPAAAAGALGWLGVGGEPRDAGGASGWGDFFGQNFGGIDGFVFNFMER